MHFNGKFEIMVLDRVYACQQVPFPVQQKCRETINYKRNLVTTYLKLHTFDKLFNTFLYSLLVMPECYALIESLGR